MRPRMLLATATFSNSAPAFWFAAIAAGRSLLFEAISRGYSLGVVLKGEWLGGEIKTRSMTEDL